ncbi:DgyrCDS2004 [Dimorphilus gyrociliatus]|uniref:DgyrCDS2004 n=1 Tax=Dimorphilus gyrociliatus TaxID=2664684 RepID=A0A7I8VAR9_9ANNE|nr:DgyrCDS2004 [Dimorphilus gyrociliatus]
MSMPVPEEPISRSTEDLLLPHRPERVSSANPLLGENKGLDKSQLALPGSRAQSRDSLFCGARVTQVTKFPWQRDIGVQCELLKADPPKIPPPPPSPRQIRSLATHRKSISKTLSLDLKSPGTTVAHTAPAGTFHSTSELSIPVPISRHRPSPSLGAIDDPTGSDLEVAALFENGQTQEPNEDEVNLATLHRTAKKCP